MIAALRTPDEKFVDLPNYAFAPHYIDDLAGYDGLRLHYLDEGARTAQQIFLCLHGQPTWSYLYRKMIPVFTAAGHRVVAPDFFGFGRSDKPIDEAVYNFDFHRNMLLRLIERLDLRRVTLVVQDWGGLIGLTIPMAMPDRFARLIVMNTMFAGGDEPLGEGFLAWRAWCAKNPDMDIGKLMGRSCKHLSPAERGAYDAPYPDGRYKAGVRRFPPLVPEFPDSDGALLGRQARAWFEQHWQGQSFMAVGMEDPVLGPPIMAGVRRHIRHCPPPFEVAEGGHFLQEWGDQVAARALAYFG
jgi:haloalkane dehalogenase/tRNA(adenine34) deaminase